MKRKVLVITNSLYGGGAERVLQTLIKNIDTDKFQITLYSVNQDKLNPELYPGVDYHYIFRQDATTSLKRLFTKITNKLILLIYYHLSPRVFYKLFIKGKYDVEVAFIEGYSTRIVSGSDNPDSLKYAWVHIDMLIDSWSLVAYRDKHEEREAYGNFDKIIGVSETVVSNFRKRFCNISQVIVLHNPIDSNTIVAASERHARNLSSKNKFRFLSVGRLVEQKGYDRLITIISRMRTNGYNVELWILGEGPQRPQLEQLIKGLKLQDNVVLKGFEENPYPYFRQCDAFVCSSRFEGYSTVITEALILGMPIVATNCAGMDELLGPYSEYGILTSNTDDALYNGMVRMTQPQINDMYREKAATRGREFSLGTLISNIETLFLEEKN